MIFNCIRYLGTSKRRRKVEIRWEGKEESCSGGLEFEGIGVN